MAAASEGAKADLLPGVFETLLAQYELVFCLDYQKNQIITLACSCRTTGNWAGQTFDWLLDSDRAADELTAPGMGAEVAAALKREGFEARLQKAGGRIVLSFYTKWKRWCQMAICPLERFNTSEALVTVHDLTASCAEMAALLSEHEAEVRRTHYYARLFASSSEDVYSRILYVDIASGIIYRICYEQGRVAEYQERKCWPEYYLESIKRVHPDDAAGIQVKINNGRLCALPVGKRVTYTYRSRASDGEYRWLTSKLDVIDAYKGKKGALIFSSDITEAMNERERLKDLGEHDALTDLFNRVKLDQLMRGEYQQLTSCGVIYIDINDLKRVNDVSGHDMGDQLICRVAGAIRSITCRTVQGYRIGGDEFLVIACNVCEEELNRLLDMFFSRLCYIEREKRETCSVSAGTAWEDGAVDIAQLMKRADADMYKNKIRKKAGVCCRDTR